jgi:hypothetical protein
VEAGHVGAFVGAAELGDDGLDFRPPLRFPGAQGTVVGGTAGGAPAMIGGDLSFASGSYAKAPCTTSYRSSWPAFPPTGPRLSPPTRSARD